MTVFALIEKLVHYVYRLHLDILTEYAVFTALIFCTLCRKYDRRRWFRPGVGIVLGIWAALVLWVTLLSRSCDAFDVQWIPLHTYWRVLHGANSELLRSAFMNVILFFPAGLLTAALFPRNKSYRCRMLCTALFCGLFSLSIEMLQYFLTLGNAEIDDVLHNTLGALVGFAAFHIEWDGS